MNHRHNSIFSFTQKPQSNNLKSKIMSFLTKPPTPASLQASINSTKVEYVQLGSSGLRVSSPILGVMAMGSKKWNAVVMEEEESLQVLKAAWERGTPFS
jgi:hypothetical protein